MGNTWSDQYRSTGRKPRWENLTVKVTRQGEIVTQAGKFHVIVSVQTTDDIVTYAFSPAAKAAVSVHVEKRRRNGEKFAELKFELIKFRVK